MKSGYLTASRRPDEGLRAADAGLAIDPNYADLVAWRSLAETYLRQFEQAKSDVQQAAKIRLSPRDPENKASGTISWPPPNSPLGHFDAAIEESSKAIDVGWKVFYAYLNLATAHALKGDMDEANTALAEARRLNPKLSVKWLTEREPFRQPWLDALLQGGVTRRSESARPLGDANYFNIVVSTRKANRPYIAAKTIPEFGWTNCDTQARFFAQRPPSRSCPWSQSKGSLITSHFAPVIPNSSWNCAPFGHSNLSGATLACRASSPFRSKFRGC